MALDFNHDYHIKLVTMNVTSVIGGLAGAGTLTLLNETVKKLDKEAPRLDLIGMNAVAKVIKGAGIKNALFNKSELLPVALAGDLLSNSLYYGLADAGDKNKTLLRGALLGLGAGLGAVLLSKPLGIDVRVSDAPLKTKVMTVAWYVAGGLVAAAVTNLLSKSEKLKSLNLLV